MDRIYCGSGKIISTDYGTMPKISFNKDDINTIVKYMKDNNLEWINLDMKEKRDPKNKNTHYLEVDTWKPEENKNRQQTDISANNNDLPF